MTHTVIPAEAVEAARKVALERYGTQPDAAYIRTLLTAAAPFIEQAAYDEGFGEGYRSGQESMDTE